MIREISNTDDTIDSRDIIARIDALEADDARTEYESAELVSLKALADEADGSPDWTHGETLIRDSYFESYAQELADAIGAIDRNARWPLNCIDWTEAARQLQDDYFTVEFDNVTYWIRS